jgi:CRISPR-associated protein Csd2
MVINNRYDFVLLFDVIDGNPNGDPDAGNLPRVDAESGHGLVTDVCIKRKVRNYIQITKDQAEITELQDGEKKRYEIYVKEKAVLNRANARAYAANNLKPEEKKLPKNIEDAKKITGWMCSNFYDIRTFGAVLSTEINCGQVRGPVQFTFARSIDPVVTLEHSITRMAVTNEKDLEKERTMGRKFTIPYGLYRAHGFVSAPLANQTGFSEDDLSLLWEALSSMFEHDRSAARGMMATRGLYIFEHDSKMGNAPAHELFDRVSVKRKDASKSARSFADYEISINTSGLSGVKLIRKVG